MSKHQFGLLAMAIVLLSPTFVSANDANSATNLSIGNIQITTTDNGTSIKTPKIQIDNPSSIDRQTLISRTRQRSRNQIRRKRATTTIVSPRVDPDDNEPKIIRSPSLRTPRMPSVPNVPSVPTSTIRTNPTVRSSTVRTINDDDNSQSTSEQTQSVQCSGGSGSSVSQSSTTINGRTVNSESRSNCR